jgi:iduronate 2-sulfatase
MVKRFQSFGFELGKENDVLRREYTQAYHACISYIDAQLGLLFDSLKLRGLWDDTIVIFTSDHGYHLGEHFMWGKVTLFEECARVPLIVRVPGMTKPGSITKALIEHVDFYPTLLELCGLENSRDLQGISFVPILKNPSLKGKQATYTVVSRGEKLGRSIRTQKWRYAEWGAPNLSELYDLEKDPNEYTNLAKDSNHRVQLRKMQGLLQAVRKRATQHK